MRKIVGSALTVLVVTAAGACRTAAPAAQGGEAGAASAATAVERFVQAARTTDVRGMSTLFGTPAGPVSGSPEDVEKRMRALACYLAHDAARVVEDVPGIGRGRMVTVEMRQRELVRRPRFTAVSGPRGRWFVESFDINTVADFCRGG